MANPQLENGYIKIANEIWQALCRFRIPGESRMVLDFIIFKTYGFNKKEDAISLSQIVLGTGLKKPEVCRSLRKLLASNLVSIGRKATPYGNTYKLNKDFENWKSIGKKATPLADTPTTIGRYANESLAKKPHTQYNYTKDNMTKEREAPPNSEFFNNPSLQETTIQWLMEKGITKALAESEIKKFIDYWTESSKSGHQVRWQGEKFFDVRRRLITWFKRIKDFNYKSQNSKLNIAIIKNE